MRCPSKKKPACLTPAKFAPKMMQDTTLPVMHACGHDLHMAAIRGHGEIMAHSKNTWHGTLMLIGQPAEETIGGAEGNDRGRLVHALSQA